MSTTSKPLGKAVYVAPGPDWDWLQSEQRRLYTRSEKQVDYVFCKLWGLVTDPRNLRTALARVAGSRIEEGHLMMDHVHMMISIPPKYSVAQVTGYIKGKSAIHIARTFGERKWNFVGQHFWARGYFVSTIGGDEVVIREYIRRQKHEDRRLDRLRLVYTAATLERPQPQPL